MSSRRPRAVTRPAGPAPASPTPGRRAPDLLLATLAAALALALLYPGPLFQGRVFASSDARNADAFGLVGDAELARGEYPLWNPYLFGGMPSFGSLSYVRYVYPPASLTGFLQSTLGFPPLTWLFVHLLFGALGAAVLARRFALPAPAQALAALAWILSPNVVAWAVHGHGSKLGAAMYMPWILAAALAVLAGGGRRWVAALALLLGLQVLRGHVQITYYTLLAVGLLALGQTVAPFLREGNAGAVPPRGERGRRLAAVAGGLGLAFLLGAVLLLPVREYAGISVRGLAESGGGATYAYATGWSFSPVELPTLVLPAASGFGRGSYCGPMPFTDYPNYFGILWLGLALAAVWSGRGRLALWLGIVTVLAVLVSFGRHGSPLFDLLYRHLPFFNKFRVPVMIMVLPAAALALLAALGLGALLGEPRGERERRARAALPAATAALGALLLLLGATGAAHGPFLAHLRGLAAGAQKALPPAEALAASWSLHRADLVRIGLLLLGAGGALAWAARDARFRRAGLGWALAALVALDLGGVAARILHPERGLVDVGRDASGRAVTVPARPLLTPYVPAREDLGRGAVYREAAARAGHDRVWPLGGLASDNEFMAAGVRSLGGYHPAKPAAAEQIRRRLYEGEDPAGRVAAWLAARVVAVPGELPPDAGPYLGGLGLDLALPPFARDGAMVLYENRAAGARARLYDRWTPAPSPANAAALDGFLDRLQAGAVDWRGSVALDRPPDPAPVAAGAPLPPPEFVRDGLNEVALRTRAPVPTVLLLADLAAPGWRVTVDGRPAAALRGDLALRAVAVPAGDHTVVWRYRDPALARGLALSGLGTLGLLALLAPWPVRRRGGGPAARTGEAA